MGKENPRAGKTGMRDACLLMGEDGKCVGAGLKGEVDNYGRRESSGAGASCPGTRTPNRRE
jgi:hypothetical protein